MNKVKLLYLHKCLDSKYLMLFAGIENANERGSGYAFNTNI